MGILEKWEGVRGDLLPTILLDVTDVNSRTFAQERSSGRPIYASQIMAARRTAWAFIAEVNQWLPHYLMVKCSDKNLAFDRIADAIIALELTARKFDCAIYQSGWVIWAGDTITINEWAKKMPYIPPYDVE